MNIVLIIISLVVVLIIGYNAFLKSKRTGTDFFTSGGMSLVTLLDAVKEEIAEIVKDDTFQGSSEADFRNALNRKAKIMSTLREAADGKDSAKEIVIDLIYNIVTKLCPNTQDLINVIPFNSPTDLDPHVKFEILMHHYKQELIRENFNKPVEERDRNPEKDAFKVWVSKYKLNEAKYYIEDGSKASYLITKEEVNDTYEKENLKLAYTDMAQVVSILLFQRYKGFGCIDTVRALDINGVNIGVSGSILTYLRTQEHTATASVWANYKGRYIHLRFLDFGSAEEVRRVVQLLCRYNSPGPLTERRGYIVNNMYDESRILAVRPPFSEYWGAFIRKFGADHKTLHFLIYKDYIMDWELPLNFIKFLMYGGVTTSFTGRQGCGKTTMMTATIEYMDPRHNLRVIEMAFEMNAREHYPERNIMSLQETEFLEAKHAQDAQKKSDGAVSLFGEVATDIIAAKMIQTGRVASLFTIFSHHGKTAPDTVYALSDSIVAATGMSDRAVAEKQVIDVLHVDVHLDYTADGKYYVERITEIIKLPESIPYPELDPDNLDWSRAQIEREYYTRSTDRKTFEVQDIIKYDLDTDTYFVVAPPSIGLTKDMMAFMDKDKRDQFTEFLQKEFGVDVEHIEDKIVLPAPKREISARTKALVKMTDDSIARQKESIFIKDGKLAVDLVPTNTDSAQKASKTGATKPAQSGINRENLIKTAGTSQPKITGMNQTRNPGMSKTQPNMGSNNTNSIANGSKNMGNKGFSRENLIKNGDET